MHCEGFRRTEVSRRRILELGAAGFLGLSLSRALEAESKKTKSSATARSVILLFQFGGASHIDTFDPKPGAPSEVRGEFKAISTSVPGIQVSEHLPRMAKIAHKYALVRSVHHNRSSHNPAAYYSLTGREPLEDRVTLNAAATDFPHPGSVTDYLIERERLHERGGARSKVPTFVSLPTMIADGPFRTPGEFAGLLGKKHDPLFITRDPNSPGFKVSELALPQGVGIERIEDRKAILTKLETLSRLRDSVYTTKGASATKGMGQYQERAIELLTSPATQQAFAMDEEPPAVRDRYGRTTYGQSCLLARRLVEAGVRFVTVYYSPGIGGWDTHKDNFNILKGSRLPQTDQSVSALLEDLDSRGLLSETLVYWTGDFGRTPKINGDAGRDHWPQCQTVLLAGGGVRGGLVHGSSDSSGAYPETSPVLPDDITATLYTALGFEPETEMYDQLGRPMPISKGRAIEELLS